MLTTIKELQQKPVDEVKAWEKSYNFKSQFSILNEVTDSENVFEKRCIATGDKTIKHSSYYLNALKNALIKEVVYEDGSTTYDYNLYDASIVNIVNQDGMVIVDKVLYQYTNHQLKSMPYNGTNSINTLAKTNKSINNISIVDLVQMSSLKVNQILSTYNWSQTGSWSSTWDHGKRRARIAVTGYSNSSGYSSNTIVYNVNVRVEKKNFWGNWGLGDFTCCYLYSSWQYKFGLQHNSTPFNCDIYYKMSPLSSTPVTCSYPTYYWPAVNNLVVNLEPNGTTFASSMGYDTFCDAVNVYHYSFSGSVCGGTSGVTLYAVTR